MERVRDKNTFINSKVALELLFEQNSPDSNVNVQYFHSLHKSDKIGQAFGLGRKSDREQLVMPIGGEGQ